MPATAQEKYRGRSLDNGSAEIMWVVKGTDSDTTARSTVASSTPSTHDGKPIDHIKVEQEADEIWYCTAVYQIPSGATVAESSFSFDTGGGSQHITQSKSTADSAGGGLYTAAAPDFGGAIGVNGTGVNSTVEGCDIVVPVYNFSETHIFDDSVVDTAYKSALFQLTGTVNDDTFRECAAGECLFLGASGSKRGTGDWEITFRFAASPNKTGINIEGMTVDKKGWEYLWVYYEDQLDATANIMVKRPIGVYVEVVYDEGDFDGLEL